jgi:anti-anti-sigma regulatory factor
MQKSPSGQMLEAKKWHVETRERADGIIVSTLMGVADGPFAEEIERQLLKYLGRGIEADWIADASSISKTEASLIGPAKQVLKSFKENGGRFVVVVTQDPMIQMTARTISFGSKMLGGATVDDVANTIDEAVAKLDKLRRRKESA